MTKLQAFLSSREYSPRELEIMKERASALGRAGDQLEHALTRYELACRGTDHEQQNNLCRVAAGKLWALVVQRELLGFVHDNERWLQESFAIPEQVWSCYGRL